MIIRIFILLFIVASVSMGCAKITYKDGEISYFRLGPQKIDGFKMEKTGTDTLMVNFSRQEGGESIAEIVKTLADKIPVPPIIP